MLDVAADLLLGGRCPGCERPGHGLCRACRELVGAGRVHFAGRSPSPLGYPLTVCAGEYAGVLRRLVARYKDERLLALSAVLGERLALSVVHLLAAVGRIDQCYRLVPVPSRPAVVRERALDHTRTLARQAARRLHRSTGLKLQVQQSLRSIGAAADQAGLGAAARLANREGQFRATRWPEPQAAAILIDDVSTTGATLAAAATTLRRAGVPVLGAAVVAATVRRQPQHSPG